MSDIIERVARAIGKTVAGRSEDITPWTLVAAVAAIEAMREPTPEMIQATGLRIGAVLDSYQSMIDQALKEAP